MTRAHVAKVAVAATAAVISLTIGLVTTGWAGATPGSGTAGTIVAQGETSDPVHVQATGNTQIIDQQVTIQPGGFTGWHFHPGPVLAVVVSGTLTHYDESCAATSYTAGQAFEEQPGRQHVHMGANLGSDPVVLAVTYILPVGDPLRVEAPAPSCASSLLRPAAG